MEIVSICIPTILKCLNHPEEAISTAKSALVLAEQYKDIFKYLEVKIHLFLAVMNLEKINPKSLFKNEQKELELEKSVEDEIAKIENVFNFTDNELLKNELTFRKVNKIINFFPKKVRQTEFIGKSN